MVGDVNRSVVLPALAAPVGAWQNPLNVCPPENSVS